MRRLLRKAARVALWTVVVAGVLALVLLGILRTAPGRRALLRVALPLVNAKMAGHLAVRGIDGDLWHRLVLLDARLDDAEGVEIVFARRIEARVDLEALWYGRVHIEDLRIDGARLTLRHLTNNKLNLAALGRPPSAREQVKAIDHEDDPKKPFLMEVDHFHLQVDGAYHPPRGHEAHTVEWPHGTFDIDGSAQITSTQMHFGVDRLVSDARDPLHAHVELKGGLLVTPKAGPHGKVEIAFENVALTATSDGDEIARLSPMLHPRGRWQVHAEGGGPLSHLRARAIIDGPKGSVTVDGVLARGEILRWGGNVIVSGIDPAADWGLPGHALPEGQIDVALRAGGEGNTGELIVERLRADGGGVHVDAHGRTDFGGRGDAVVHASVASLAGIGRAGVKLPNVDELDGRIALDATLGRDADGPRLVARVHGERLWVRHDKMKATAQTFAATATIGPGRPMHVRLEGRDLAVAGVQVAKRTQPLTLPVRTLALTMDGQPDRFRVAGEAALPDGTDARFAARTTMGKTAIDATVTALSIARGKRHFVLAEPAHMHVTGTANEPHIAASAAGMRVAATMRIGRDKLTADATVDAPSLAGAGRLVGVALGGALHASLHLALDERLTLDATVDGTRLEGPHVRVARLGARLHSVELVGTAHVEADGIDAGGTTLERLALDVRGSRERLSVTLDGRRAASDRGGAARLRMLVDGTWRTDALQVVRADLLVHTAELMLPRQSWQLAAPAKVIWSHDQAIINGLRIRSGVGELAVDGSIGRASADLTLLLRDGDLAEVSRAAGRPGLLPPARWSGRVHIAGTMTAPLVDATLEARANKTVAWLGFGLNALSLRAFIDAHHAILHADARGRDDTRVVVDAHGEPRKQGDRFTEIATTLDRVQLTVHGHTWQLRAPCAIDIGARIAVDDCRLTVGKGELAITGNAPLEPKPEDRLEATLTTRHLDLRDIHALLAPGHQEPPKTDFEIHAHLTGTRASPVVDLQLAGHGSEIDEGGLPENVLYKISAHYANKRVSGQASARQSGMSLGIGATFDLPVTLDDDEQPVTLELEARPVPFYKIRQLLPAKIADIKGFFSLRVRASGTTRHPTVNAELHVPSWGLDNLRDNNSIANLSYDGHELVVNSVTSFEAQGLIGSLLRLHPPRNSGTVTMELRAPVDLVRLLRAPRDAVHALVHDAPLVASAEVRNVDLTKVPLQIVGWDPPITSGRLDAKIRGGGTMHRPTLHAQVKGLELAKPGIFDHLDVVGDVQWENGRVQLSGRAALRGAPLVTYRGVAQLEGRRLFDGDGWQNGALDIDFDVPSYPLARLRNLQPRLHAIDGTVHAQAQLRGTFASPELRVALDGRDVGLAHGRFARLGGELHLRQSHWSFDLSGRDGGGGDVRVAGDLPADWDAPMRMSIDARALDVGFLGTLWEEIGDVGGRLDAHVRVDGTRNAPRPNGEARLDGGHFGFRGDSRRYTAALAVRIDGDSARLERLSLRGGDGTLEAKGSAQLDGLKPLRMQLSARAHAFTVAYGSAEARLDADFTLAGDRAKESFRGALAIERGSIVLPALGGLGAREELGGMPDVRFDDLRSRGAARAVSSGQAAFVALRVSGPIALRSREAELDLAGDLDITVAGGALGIEGVVEGRRGTVALLGKRYEVERAQLAFGGPADDPELHLRVTRRVNQATVAVVIEGTAKNPSVRLSCEPPIYDEAQLTSMVLAGGPGTERIAVRDLNRQITGLLSAVVVRKIREQLAPSLPIDLVRPLDQQSYAEFSAAPIEVGRFVSDKVYVRYEQHYGGSRLGRSAANSDEASAEYQLGKGFELATSFGDAGVGGIYLFWTKKR